MIASDETMKEVARALNRLAAAVEAARLPADKAHWPAKLDFRISCGCMPGTCARANTASAGCPNFRREQGGL